jgi:hypothetical protein
MRRLAEKFAPFAIDYLMHVPGKIETLLLID